MGEAETATETTASLREASQKIRALLADANRGDARTRYQVGAVVADVKRSAHKYGVRGVARLARELGQDEQSLYRYASVAQRWTSAQVETILRRETKFGQPLSWSHLVVLAGVESNRQRAQLLDVAIREALSVRELALLVAKNPGQRQGKTVGVAVERFVRTIERWSREVAEMHHELLESLNADSTDPAEAETFLERAIAAEQRLSEMAQEQIRRLRAQRSRLQRHEGPVARVLIAGG